MPNKYDIVFKKTVFVKQQVEVESAGDAAELGMRLAEDYNNTPANDLMRTKVEYYGVLVGEKDADKDKRASEPSITRKLY